VCALAGCGGGDGGGGGATTGGATQANDVADNERQLLLDNAFDNGADTCSQYSRKDLAATYGVENEPEAIAKAVAARETDPELREQARKGCLAAFQK
jgi:hypothetical protein